MAEGIEQTLSDFGLSSRMSQEDGGDDTMPDSQSDTSNVNSTNSMEAKNEQPQTRSSNASSGTATGTGPVSPFAKVDSAFNNSTQYDAATSYPLYLRLHSASPSNINRTIYNAVRNDNSNLLKQIVKDVGVAHILRHCMIIVMDKDDDADKEEDGAVNNDALFSHCLRLEAAEDGEKEDAAGGGTTTTRSTDAMEQQPRPRAVTAPAVVASQSKEEEQEEAVTDDIPTSNVDENKEEEDKEDEVKKDDEEPDAKEEKEERDDEVKDFHHDDGKIVSTGRTLFHVAAFQGAYKVIDVLANACMEHFSTNNGDDDQKAKSTLVRLLNLATRSGSVPLLIAAYLNHGSVVKTLLKHGVDPNLSNTNGSTAAIIASCRNAVDVLRALGCHPDTDFNQCDAHGTAPCLAACIHSSVEALRYLYEYRRNIGRVVDLTATDNAGFGCAALAGKHNRPKVISYLSSIHRVGEGDCTTLSPDLNQRVVCENDDDPFNLDPPIHIATRWNSVEAVEAFLRSRHCDVTARNFQGRTALHVAVVENRVDVVRCYASLSQEDVELLDAEDITGMTPFYVSCKLGLSAIVEILAPISDTEVMCIVEEDDDIEQPISERSEGTGDADEVTGELPAATTTTVPVANRTISQPPLLAAVLKNHVDCVQILLTCGVDVNQTDDRGHTALSVAAKHGYLQMCKVLLSKGADPSLRSIRGGGTPLQKARKYKNTDVVELLEKHELLRRLSPQTEQMV